MMIQSSESKSLSRTRLGLECKSSCPPSLSLTQGLGVSGRRAAAATAVAIPGRVLDLQFYYSIYIKQRPCLYGFIWDLAEGYSYRYVSRWYTLLKYFTVGTVGTCAQVHFGSARV